MSNAARARRRQQDREWRAANGHQPRAPRVFPLQPILDAIADRIPKELWGQPRTAAENRILGLQRGIRRDYAINALSAYQADRVCVRIGKHPAEVFGPAWHCAADLETVDA